MQAKSKSTATLEKFSTVPQELPGFVRMPEPVEIDYFPATKGRSGTSIKPRRRFADDKHYFLKQVNAQREHLLDGREHREIQA